MFGPSSRSDVTERLRALNSNSGVSDQLSVGSSSSRDACVLKLNIFCKMVN